MKKTILFISITISLVFFGNLYVNYRQNIMTTYGSLGGDFTLQGADGSISLKNLRGQVVVMYMGFTHCPDICPTSLTTMAKALESLPTDVGIKVLPIFISVDHARDKPADVDSYIKYYIPGGVGLTGNKEEIDKVVKQYGAYYQFVDSKDSAMEYTVDHTSRFYIIDANGVLKETVMDAQGAEVLAQTITKVARQ